MSDTQKLIKLAKQNYKNRLPEQYSKNDTNEVLRQAFIDLNGGSTKLDFKALRRNGAAMFEIIEQIL
ncbi:MAG TPA: hypothetical protein GX708_18920, partial [Gallicola sp.]|nr:hypothetical protein [Gallicola sp.]